MSDDPDGVFGQKPGVTEARRHSTAERLERQAPGCEGAERSEEPSLPGETDPVLFYPVGVE
jgi:hypothetical protein